MAIGLQGVVTISHIVIFLFLFEFEQVYIKEMGAYGLGSLIPIQICIKGIIWGGHISHQTLTVLLGYIWYREEEGLRERILVE